jgi:F-type H+-transporting ATPase subunit delta
MTNRASAARYARALFDVARQEQVDLAVVQRDLSGFARLVAGNGELQRALTNPAIPVGRKRALLDALLARSGGLAPMVTKLLQLLAEHDRLNLLPDLDAAFEQRLMDYRQVVRAELRTATPLPDDRIAALREGLQRATGRDVQLETRVDPSIIGGAVARIGSTVYDGSVTRQLQKLKASLIDAAQ